MQIGMRVDRLPGAHLVTLERPEEQNSLTPELVVALHDALDACEQDPAARAFVIKGSGGHFSSGMDLVSAADGKEVKGAGGDAYLCLLDRFTGASVVVVSFVDGKASGGGVGLAAASDFVFASEESTFSLPELLWGLLPCVVAPFLIRRVGFQVCLRLTLSTLPISAEEAQSCGLVDGIGEPQMRRLLQRLRSVAPEGVRNAKGYLRGLWIVNDETKAYALDELDRLLATPEVSERLRAFADHQRYPWEQGSRLGGAR